MSVWSFCSMNETMAMVPPDYRAFASCAVFAHTPRASSEYQTDLSESCLLVVSAAVFPFQRLESFKDQFAEINKFSIPCLWYLTRYNTDHHGARGSYSIRQFLRGGARTPAIA